MKILSITRKYPPAIGGMENYMYNLLTAYPGDKTVIAYGGSQKWLLFVLIYFFCKACWLLVTDTKIRVIHIGDGVLAPLGYLLKVIFKKKIILTVHGKDVIFNKFGYQRIIPYFINKADKIVAISSFTAENCSARGIDKSKIEVVACGINPDSTLSNRNLSLARSEFAAKFNLTLENKIILTTLGRLCKRKGQIWFVENIMPLLPDEYVYLIAGADNTEISSLAQLFGFKKDNFSSILSERISSHGLNRRVVYLGKLSDAETQSLMQTSDIFIMPNQSIPGDCEGFGIVALEAGLAGIPVIASNIEGLKDAVIDTVTGSLVSPDKPAEFIQAINFWKDSQSNRNLPSSIAKTIIDRFSWQKIAQDYRNIIDKMI